MKLLTFSKVTTVLGWFITMTAPVMAGGVAGGGGPPAREQLEDMLMQGGMNTARVFAWDEQQLGLGVNAELEPEMLVTRSSDSSTTAVQISSDDFERVADKEQAIQAVNLDGDVRSYQVKRTITPDTLMLVAPP